MHIVLTVHANMIGSIWLQGASLVAFLGTKQVYHASQEPVIYIVPAHSILGR